MTTAALKGSPWSNVIGEGNRNEKGLSKQSSPIQFQLLKIEVLKDLHPRRYEDNETM